MIRDTNQFRQTTPPELHPERLLDSFVPLTKGTYPVFNKYPKFIVDYQIQERQRIRLEELEYLRERCGYKQYNTVNSIPSSRGSD